MAPIRVTARSGDEARRKAKDALRGDGRTICSMSSAQESDTFPAYVEPLPTAPMTSPPRR